jgi:hypothetical protein
MKGNLSVTFKTINHKDQFKSASTIIWKQEEKTL